MSVRLQKVLARAGVASRRASEDVIQAGRVTVNGEMVTKLGTTVDPDQDDIRVDGARIARPKTAAGASRQPLLSRYGPGPLTRQARTRLLSQAEHA